MQKVTIKWMNVEEDGLPIPDDDKTYFVLHEFGSGFGEYRYTIESIHLDKPDEFGLHYKLFKTNVPRWYLDFDGSGHEDTITDYFEIPYPKRESE